jgi:hypothetical protein
MLAVSLKDAKLECKDAPEGGVCKKVEKEVGVKMGKGERGLRFYWASDTQKKVFYNDIVICGTDGTDGATPAVLELACGECGFGKKKKD